MSRTALFRIGVFSTVALFCLGASLSSAGQAAKAPADTPAAARRAPRRPAATASTAPRAVSRQTAAARARADAAAREAADTVIPRYKVDASGDLVPDVHAAAAIVYDPASNQVLFEENSQEERSIASITKVMTAAVFLETDPDFAQQVTVTRGDVYRASTTFLRVNDKVTVGDLMHLLLIPSDNAAARTLARISPYGSEGFIQRMNEKAEELGLHSTHYADSSGLLSENVASAYDMAKLIAIASADPRISDIMRTPEYSVQALRRNITIRSTNHLLGRSDFDVMAAKTGFISKSGYCLVTLLRLPESGHEIALVILGARSNTGRFMETQNLFNWLSSKASTFFATSTPVATRDQ